VIIENPIVVLSNAPSRRPAGILSGGGNAAVVTETLRPIDGPRQGSAGRRTERQDIAERRPVQDDAEWAARMRVVVAREQARQVREQWAGLYARGADGAADPDTYISASESRRLRDRLEARIARDPGMLTLHSVDVRI
jgi:hypothetical protein